MNHMDVRQAVVDACTFQQTTFMAMLLALTHLHTLWRKKVYLSDVEVEEAERWAKIFGAMLEVDGVEGNSMGALDSASGWFVRKYRTMYFFRSVPTERRNSACKVHIQNSFHG